MLNRTMRKSDDKVDSDDESSDSGEESANQAVVTPDRFSAQRCGYSLFHASYGPAHKTLLKAAPRNQLVSCSRAKW